MSAYFALKNNVYRISFVYNYIGSETKINTNIYTGNTNIIMDFNDIIYIIIIIILIIYIILDNIILIFILEINTNTSLYLWNLCPINMFIIVIDY